MGRSLNARHWLRTRVCLYLLVVKPDQLWSAWYSTFITSQVFRPKYYIWFWCLGVKIRYSLRCGGKLELLRINNRLWEEMISDKRISHLKTRDISSFILHIGFVITMFMIGARHEFDVSLLKTKQQIKQFRNWYDPYFSTESLFSEIWYLRSCFSF